MSNTNQLIHETSPYLLQHAHNPVDWLPYSSLAFEKAQQENKPLLISIGYSSCHWCHVMEHESFENEDIANIMNKYFICVKVDREERPDVDHVYMDAVHQIHGSGGWPLNCFVLPDGKPFWGGTYFKPDQWKQLLEQINVLFQTKYEDIVVQASEIAHGVMSQSLMITQDISEERITLDFESIFVILQQGFDSVQGGLKGSPKFPMPIVVQLLLQYSAYSGNHTGLSLAELTLKKMACGGIYDQVGGGFSRYSTDSEWKVPHFEKMLYDNAQLISLYADAYRFTQKQFYKDIVDQSISFVVRELMSAEGVFYSALDADSEGEEGLYYTWTKDQFDQALGHYSELAGEYYGINERGLWEQNRNILLRPESDDLFSQQHYLSANELASLTEYCRSQLLKARSARTRPGLDDKMLVSWNALFISALVDAYVVLNRSEYLDRAAQAGTFIINNLKRKDNGLYHTWKNGKSQIDAFLDDYACTIEAFIKLYEATANTIWLTEATELAQYVVENFYDSNSGFFWYSELNDQNVFARKIEIYDGVIASGNSVMAKVLNTLGVFLHHAEFVDKSNQMLASMAGRIGRYPAGYAKWASLVYALSKKQFVVIVIGDNAMEMLPKLLYYKTPGMLIFGSKIKSKLPYFENRWVEGKTMIYICQDTYCMAPVETINEALDMINIKH